MDPREGYFGYLPSELRTETRKFRRGNVPTCKPLLTVDNVYYSIGLATIEGTALTQHGTRTKFILNVHKRDLKSLNRKLNEMDQGGPGPLEFYQPATDTYIQVAKLPSGVGMWLGDEEDPTDVLLYCNELIDAITEALAQIK